MILILGVTGGGKSRLAFELARKIGAEIISIDSMKVYRRMDIGTAKPSPEHRRQVNYHLIDVVEPSESFSVDRFLELANQAIRKVEAANRPLIAVGGTAMYIKALLYGIFKGPGANLPIRQMLKSKIDAEGLTALHQRLSQVDPQAGQKIHPNDEKRIIRALEVFELTGKPISSFQQQFDSGRILGDWNIVGIRREKDIENQRMNLRVKKMIDEGLVDEVKNLLAEEKSLSQQAGCAIGYAEIIRHLRGELSLEKAIEEIKINTRRFAKGQRSWFKTFRNVHWLDLDQDQPLEKILDRAIELLENPGCEYL